MYGVDHDWGSSLASSRVTSRVLLTPFGWEQSQELKKTAQIYLPLLLATGSHLNGGGRDCGSLRFDRIVSRPKLRLGACWYCSHLGRDLRLQSLPKTSILHYLVHVLRWLLQNHHDANAFETSFPLPIVHLILSLPAIKISILRTSAPHQTKTMAVVTDALVCSRVDGQYEVKQVVLGEMRKDELVVRIVASGICHTDFACTNVL